MYLRCSTCDKELEEQLFPRNNRKPNRNFRGNICLACQREYKKTLNYEACTYPITCTVCKEEKPAEQFTKNKRVPKGRNSTCKECMYERNRIRDKKNANKTG